MNGIVVVDKPVGMSSARTVAAVKRLLKAKKVGHTGTLDPFASGVLVCCINQATRLAQFLMEGKKSYEAVMCLGITTDTQDATGQILSQSASLDVTGEQVERVFEQYAKSDRQTPPAYSALKHQGVPLYRLARKGVFVEKPSRSITIHHLTVEAVDLPRVRFTVCCSQGTYVRTLCSDMGETLGCGGHLAELRRTESGGYTLADAVSLETLSALSEQGKTMERIVPMNEALKGVPEVQVDDDLARWIRHGRPMNEKALGPLEFGNVQWIKVSHGTHLVAILAAKEKNGILPYKCVFSESEAQRAY